MVETTKILQAVSGVELVARRRTVVAGQEVCGRTRRKLSANARRIAVAEVEEEVGGGYWHQGSFHIKCC